MAQRDLPDERINFTEDEKQALHYERFHYPDPKIQVKMKVVWFKSQDFAPARITGDTAFVAGRTTAFQVGSVEQYTAGVGRFASLSPGIRQLSWCARFKHALKTPTRA